MTEAGILFGVGVGPGDSQLMTLKAARILRTVPVVVVPCASPDKKSLALETARDAINPQAEVLKLQFAMCKDEPVRQMYRRQAADQIAAYLHAGKDVAFLTEGDVMLFSTFSYVLELLGNRFPVEVVPGISSVMASAAEIGLPLALNDQRLIVIPATHENILDLVSVFDRYDTVVLMKVHSVIESIVAVLKEKDLLDQAILIERASASNCQVHKDLAAIKNGQVSYMSQVIVSVNTKRFLR